MEAGLFAERIKALRLSLGLNQEEFGRLVGVTRQQVIRWETGRQQAPSARIDNICGLLGITQAEFWNPHFRFSPAHAKSIVEGGERLRPGPYLGTPVNEWGQALACPRCGDATFRESANYCRVCGMSLRNHCEGPERHPNRPDARYCEVCGHPTLWSRRDDGPPEDDEGM